MFDLIGMIIIAIAVGFISNMIGREDGKREGYEEYFKGNVECQKTIADTIICVNKGEKK